MPSQRENRNNHKKFFAALAKLCGDHGACINQGGIVLFHDGLAVEPEEGFEPEPGFEAETTARYMIHQVGDDGAEVEALEYNFHVQGVDVERFEPPDCDHPWHENPALINPCPACGEGE